MYWQEDSDRKTSLRNEVVDFVCTINCRSLPVDHAYALAEALHAHADWLRAEPGAGIHPISIQEAGNGWMRPEGEDEILHLSRRTKLVLRAPRSRISDIEGLKDKPMDVAGNALLILKAEVRELEPVETLFSRYNIVEQGHDEDAFLETIFQELKVLQINPRKMLPGKGRTIRTASGKLQTTSLMIAELKPDESITLQQRGIGVHQHLGFFLYNSDKFLIYPHYESTRKTKWHMNLMAKPLTLMRMVT
jgi:CRISPR-associated protein Cas6